MTTTQSFSMKIQEWPSREDLAEVLKETQKREAQKAQLSAERQEEDQRREPQKTRQAKEERRAQIIKEAIRDYLTQEFDTIVHFQVGEVDLLAGYPEAFFLPVHAFLKSLSNGLKALRSATTVHVPLYLQQYEVNDGDPAHTLVMSWSDDALLLRLEWGGPNAAPDFLASSTEMKVDLQEFQDAVVAQLKEYYQQVALLVGSLSDWQSADVAALFSDF